MSLRTVPPKNVEAMIADLDHAANVARRFNASEVSCAREEEIAKERIADAAFAAAKKVEDVGVAIAGSNSPPGSIVGIQVGDGGGMIFAGRNDPHVVAVVELLQQALREFNQRELRRAPDQYEWQTKGVGPLSQWVGDTMYKVTLDVQTSNDPGEPGTGIPTVKCVWKGGVYTVRPLHVGEFEPLTMQNEWFGGR